MKEYDVTIIGSGPAGLTAGLYGSRSGVSTVIIEKAGWGGQIATSWEVENYPGSAPDTSGPALTERMREQAESFGTEFINGEATDFYKEDGKIIVKTSTGDVKTKSLILAMGAAPRLLGVPGEGEYRGMGVSYCATCDANFFKNLRVAVVGGGDTALEEALYLTKFASHITLIHRRDTFRASKILQQRVKESGKIDILYDSTVEKILAGADGLVNKIEVKNVKTGALQEIDLEGIFIFAGHIPETKFVEGKVLLNPNGYILTDKYMQTDVEGIFAAGDVREKELRQVVTATSDGAIAAVNAAAYAEEH